jgi:quercetin dioxygenase-like cupin family protein
MRTRARLVSLTLAVVAALIARGFAEEATPPAHTMLEPGDVKWGEPSPMLPPGSKSAVLYGDPAKPGMFVIRSKMPAGYKIPAHSHPNDETVTVLNGTFMMGMGDKLDAKAARTLPPGAFATMPANTNHFAIAKTDAIVQVVAMGPLEFRYVDPRDDPRNAKK